jgi:hypothetical protein
VSRNPIRPDVPNVHDNIDTIRITNPFENEVNIPRTRTSPQYPADISSMSHQGNMNPQIVQAFLARCSASDDFQDDNLAMETDVEIKMN